MSSESQISKCKVTIIKRTINRELIDDYLEDAYKNSMELCECFKDGQEFIFDVNTILTAKNLPEDFCAWAWADIRSDILNIATGSNTPGLNQPGMAITSCKDWFRQVFFKIERMG